jgi:hypothetical protein
MKKLTLNKEMVRVLEADERGEVAGGTLVTARCIAITSQNTYSACRAWSVSTGGQTTGTWQPSI